MYMRPVKTEKHRINFLSIDVSVYRNKTSTIKPSNKKISLYDSLGSWVYRKGSLLHCYKNTLIYDIDLSVWVGGCCVGNSCGWGKGLKKLKIQDKGENTHITINIVTFVIQKKEANSWFWASYCFSSWVKWIKIEFKSSSFKGFILLPLKIAVTTIPRKLNIAPYPYKNKFCK